MSPGLPALLTRQSDVPGRAFSTWTQRAVVPAAAPPPAAVFGSWTWTWPYSDDRLDDDAACCGRTNPHVAPAAPESRVATTTRMTLLRCTADKATDAKGGGGC